MASANRKASYLFKLLMLGDAGVGKSCLLMRFVDRRYTTKYFATVGIDFKLRTVEVAGHVVKLQIWDTAGEERFHSIFRSYYRGAHGVLLVYDTTDHTSFNHVEMWLDEIQQNADEHVNIMLVGNKCDIYNKRSIGLQRAAMFAERLGIPFMETSAKSGINVDELFIRMAVNIYDRLVLERVPGGQEAEAEKYASSPMMTAIFRKDTATSYKSEHPRCKFRKSSDPCCF